MEKIFNLQRFAEAVSLTSGNDNYYANKSNVIIYALGGNDTVGY